MVRLWLVRNKSKRSYSRLDSPIILQICEPGHYGRTYFESASVDGWLEWAEMTLRHALGTPQEKETIQVLNSHLSSRTSAGHAFFYVE